MRFIVHVSSAGKPVGPALCVEADSWQRALETARRLRGESDRLGGFRVEVSSSGARAVDPTSHLTFDVSAAPSDAPLTMALAPTSRNSNPPAWPTTPELALHTITTELRVLSRREEDPSPQRPLSYREFAYGLGAGTSEATAAMLLGAQLELVKASLMEAPPGKLVHLAAFEEPVTALPGAVPLATLLWKDWRGDAVLTYPRRGEVQPGMSSLPPPNGAMPVVVPPPPRVPNATGTMPVPAAANVRPPAERTPPGPPIMHPGAPKGTMPIPATPAGPPVVTKGTMPVQTPNGPPTQTPAGGFVTQRMPSAPPPAPPARPSRTAPPPAASSAPASLGAAGGMPVIPPQSAAPFSEVPPAPATPQVFGPGIFTAPTVVPGFSTLSGPTLQGGAQAPEAMVTTVPGALPTDARSASGAPFLGSSVPPAYPSVAPTFPPEGAYASVPPPPSTRVYGQDLVVDLFEAIHDMHFAHDALEAAGFCLSMLFEKLPYRVGLVHFYDVGRREFLVARTHGHEAASLLLNRCPTADPVLATALRARRGIVFPTLRSGTPVPKVERYAHIGGAQAVAAAPCMLASRPLAAIELIDPTDGVPFSADDAAALSYVTEQFGSYLSSHGLVLDTRAIVRSNPG